MKRIGLVILILSLISSCASIKSSNFLKQKYLKGQLKPVYHSEECSTDEIFGEISLVGDEKVDESSDSIKENRIDNKDDFIPKENFEIRQKSDYNQGEDMSPFNLNPAVKRKRDYSVKLRDINFFPGLNYKARSGLEKGELALVFVIFILALLSLLLLFIIGYWAFLVCGGLLLTTGILVMAFSDRPGSKLGRAVHGLAIGMVLIFLLAVFLIVLIVWGIVELILLLIN